MKRKYNISLEIDGEKFSIEVHEPNKEQKKLLKQKAKEIQEKNKEYLQLKERVEKLQKRSRINEKLIDTEDEADVELLKDQRELLREIETLEEELKGYKDIDVNAENEKLFEYRYDLLVSGKDAHRLKDTIDKKAISYIELFVEMGERIKEAVKKK